MSLLSRRHALSLGLALATPFARGAGGPLRFARYGDWNLDFSYHLLKAALHATGEPLTLAPSDQRMNQSRAAVELKRPGSGVDVMWTMSTPQRERELLPIRIPIYRGLFGWRVLMVRAGEAQRFAQVRSLDDLKAFRFVQGHDWPDSDILAANGLNVVRGTNFEGLFGMLAKGRGDALPRSVLEVPADMQRYGQPNGLALEPGLVLRYPAAVYYFVSPERPELAALIEGGLRRLLAHGESARLLQQFHGDALALARLPLRRVLHLHNPLLPPRTPLGEAALWHQA